MSEFLDEVDKDFYPDYISTCMLCGDQAINGDLCRVCHEEGVADEETDDQKMARKQSEHQ